MAEIEFRDALRAALDEELERDERVILFGEDVAIAGGVFAVDARASTRSTARRGCSTRRSPSSR